MTHRHPSIKEVEDAVEQTRKDAVKRIRALQSICPHTKVVHGDDRRICVCCGVEERSQYSWGWPGRTIDGGYYEFIRPAGENTILNSEFVKRDSVVPYRVQV